MRILLGFGVVLEMSFVTFWGLFKNILSKQLDQQIKHIMRIRRVENQAEILCSTTINFIDLTDQNFK